MNSILTQDGRLFKPDKRFKVEFTALQWCGREQLAWVEAKIFRRTRPISCRRITLRLGEYFSIEVAEAVARELTEAYAANKPCDLRGKTIYHPETMTFETLRNFRAPKDDLMELLDTMTALPYDFAFDVMAIDTYFPRRKREIAPDRDGSYSEAIKRLKEDIVVDWAEVAEETAVDWAEVTEEISVDLAEVAL